MVARLRWAGVHNKRINPWLRVSGEGLRHNGASKHVHKPVTANSHDDMASRSKYCSNRFVM